ncbi:fatty acid synthase [Bombyx mori]|uniref:Ketosynthase family 3 (KS3) domain-containing protein n=1 Tax=Bombyx mori TaxID=7091 RepID=A0A8R2R703_BOMMO|nr:fatty acid synthase [Bombyx mori]
MDFEVNENLADTNILKGEEIVISGISGVFPNSDNVVDFMRNLYDKVDMISDIPRWALKSADIPKHLGKINGVEKFDAQFFKVGYQLTCVLDPLSRKLLEQTYGAIFDSGTNLTSLKGKKVGVFIGTSLADTGTMLMYDVSNRSDFVINGASKAMFANRISYWMDAKGPSYGLDCSCASSAVCLEQAYRSMKLDECEAAVVGGCSFCLDPILSGNMRRAGLLCLDGKTKCFDKHGDGYVRAEAISVIFLQKAKDAKRIYAEVYHAKSSYNLRPDAEFLPLRTPENIQGFLKEFYSEIDIKPTQVEYVEAHGAGIAQADANEITALNKVFVDDKPVKIGCVKSNMGHADAASGICGITKLCLAYHQGKLAPNLHYNEPQDLAAIRDERVQVVTEPTPFSRGYTALNNFSYNGVDCHLLLKGHFKEKDPQKYRLNIPYLILASGRQDESVQKILDLLKKHPLDPEQIALLHSAFEHDIFGHTSRGYTILDTNSKNEIIPLKESVEYYAGLKRPVWFVFSGMGSQWTGMGADLMKINTFAAAIEKCRKVLEPKNIDIVKIITGGDKSLLESTLNSFVGIAAVQAGLIDIIKELGIVPDYIFGHSLGEMACSYYDGSFTIEEFILTAFTRGFLSTQSSVIEGCMAAVGLGYQSIASQCPPEIDIACHNSFESTTISGPAEVTKLFVDDLKKRGIFAKEVPSGNVPFHSRYIGVIGQTLLESLQKIIKEPKPRSEKWLSTSVPQHKWNELSAKYSSPEYHTNNTLSPVLFHEVTKLIPDDAVVIEIAPHGLLQAILKRSLKDCIHIPLTKRGTNDSVQFLLEAIGKIYAAGLHPKIEKLYPKIEFPVATQTPFLSNFVAWEHSEDWPQLSYESGEKFTAISRDVIISIHDDDYKFLEGHLRNGLNILSEAKILVLLWETLAMYKNMDYRYLSVIFKDIHFHREVEIKRDIPLRLSISITKGNNKFEVIHENMIVVSGIVRGVKVFKFHHDIDETEFHEDEILLNNEDIYEILKLRGHYYTGEHKSIASTNLERNKAIVRWNNNWALYLDSLIQLNILANEHEGLSIPKFIGKIRISVFEHEKAKQKVDNSIDCHVANIIDTYGVTRCAGVEIDRLIFTEKAVIDKEADGLQILTFCPQYPTEEVSLQRAVNVVLKIVAENSISQKIIIIKSASLSVGVSETIEKVIQTEPMEVELDTLDIDNSQKKINSMLVVDDELSKVNLVIIDNIVNDKQKLTKIQRIISEDTFLLTFEQDLPKIHLIKNYFNVITCMSNGNEILILLKRIPLHRVDRTCIPINDTCKYGWMDVSEELKKTNVIMISDRQSFCGISGLVKKIRREGCQKLSAISIEDTCAPKFDPDHSFYKNQLDLNLANNVFKKGQWGGYYYTSSEKSASVRNVILINKQPGSIDELTWAEAPVTTDSERVEVWYAGLSLRDCQKAVSCENNNRSYFGMDFSGYNSKGEKIMGLVREGSLSSSVEADPDLTWSVPEHWTLEDAATVPLAYLHAFYCLALRSNVSSGKTVFITGGAGALGQAVISICLAMNCSIYTTVKDIYKKNFLLQLFPELPESHIGFSHLEALYNMPVFNSENKRCDIIINLDSGHLREALMKCVRASGIFLDISKSDMNKNKDFYMGFIRGDRSYKAVDFSNIFRIEFAEDKKILRNMIAQGIAKGIVRPLSRVVYPNIAVTKAFKLLSSSKHKGKVLVQMKDPDFKIEQNIPSRMTYLPNAVYIVVCDDTYLGIEFADNIIKKGARKVMINTNNEISGYVYSKLMIWHKLTAAVKLTSYLLNTKEGCTRLLKDSAKIGQLKGIFVVSNSERREEDTEGSRKKEKQINIELLVYNLDVVSRSICNGLSNFVLISKYSQSDTYEYQMGTVEKIFEARNEMALTSLVVRYDGLDTFTDVSQNTTKIHRSTLFDAVEKSIRLNHKYVYVYKLRNKKPSDYHQMISRILGIKTLDGADDTHLISDFKLNEIRLLELKNLIMNYFKVDFPVKQIQSMSLESLKDLGKIKKKPDTNFNSGLGAFIACVDDEETHVTMSHNIVSMKTLLNKSIENDLDPENTFITLIPGFEGRHQIFETLAETLKVKAVAVHLSSDIAMDSLPEIAAQVCKLMKTKFKVKSKFYLLGYSFGVNIALELAAILEKEGHVGTVYCLDSSPDVLRDQLGAYLGNPDENELQNNVIEHIYQLLTNQNSQLGNILSTADTWEEKLHIGTKEIKKYSAFSHEYIRSIVDDTYKRIELAKNYKPDIILASELVLIKGVPHPSSRLLPDDYNLSKYSSKPVKVYQIDIDHSLATYDCRVSNIINSLLENTLLEEYKKNNLCDVYFM